ncbi:hypothetical protein Sjap_013053 [Stephania japonica]|uniref:Rx N-terminal domain-containing protein n=1 Tax=Stephania japonica TaxID=461633 RepID=A0AAP0IZN4_9MAGN
MAEIVAGPLIEMLISSIQREITLVWVVKTEVMKLSKTLSAIRDVLADAEEKQIKDKKVRDWLMKLKDVAYDAQDVLDDWATDELDLVRRQPDQSDEQKLITLPQSTSKLCSLRQLENGGCWGLRGMPSGIGKGLSRLEKLSMWPLVCESGGHIGKNFEELRGLSLLHGSLLVIIKELSKDEDNHLDDVKEEVVTNKTYLSKLHISFESDDYDSAEQVLRVLKPPSNIESLRIEGYSGRRFPEWMEEMRSFPRLRSIKLYYMWNVEEWGLNWRHKEGEECFPSLQHLKIGALWNLKALPQELGNLTSLETLSIRHCYELVSMPQLQLHLMTSLKKLTISDCPKLKFEFHGLRHLTSLQDLSIIECPGVEIPKGNWTHLLLFGVHPFSKILIYCTSTRATQVLLIIHDQDSTISEIIIRGEQVFLD